MNRVLNRVTENNQSLEWCDFVACINCGKKMLVDVGEEECPECKMVGTFYWVSDSVQEINLANMEKELNDLRYELAEED